MSYLLVGDPHLELNNLKTAEKLFCGIHDIISSEGNLIHSVVFMGDIYVTKGILRTEVQNFLLESIQKLLSKFNINVYLIVGNHDMVGKSTEHALQFLKNEFVAGFNSRFHIVDSLLPIGRLGRRPVFAMPYVHDPNEFVEFANRIKDYDYDTGAILLCHQSFRGFSYNNGLEIGGEGVDQNLIDPCVEVIYSGHIHMAQSKGRVNYVGVPFTHSQNEANYIPMILALLVSKDNEVMNIPHVKYTEKYQIPRHISYDMTFRDGKFEYKNAMYHKNYDVVRVVIRCNRSELINFNKQLLTEEIGKNGFVPETLTCKYDIVEDVPLKFQIPEQANPREMFDTYVNAHDFKDLTPLIKQIGYKVLLDAV